MFLSHRCHFSQSQLTRSEAELDRACLPQLGRTRAKHRPKCLLSTCVSVQLNTFIQYRLILVAFKPLKPTHCLCLCLVFELRTQLICQHTSKRGVAHSACITAMHVVLYKTKREHTRAQLPIQLQKLSCEFEVHVDAVSCMISSFLSQVLIESRYLQYTSQAHLV